MGTPTLSGELSAGSCGTACFSIRLSSTDLMAQRKLSKPTGSKRSGLRSDRGRARYFHGREEIRGIIAEQLQDAKENGRGTTVLVQGPPGAGKTALLAQAIEEATASGFKAVEVDPECFTSSSALLDALGKSLKAGWIRGVSIRLFGVFSINLNLEKGSKGVIRILRKAARKKALLLVIDEAQELAKYRGKEGLGNTLGKIHNGEVGAPVVLLCGGLSNTRVVMRTLGISRFMDECMHQLEGLTDEESRRVIRDWLVHDGKANEEDIAPLIDEIVEECHGWPQHIVIFCKKAVKQLLENDGNVTEELTHKILEAGRERKEVYYAARITLLGGDVKGVLRTAAHIVERNGYIPETDLIDLITKSHTRESAREVEQELIRRGVIVEGRRGYKFPIPSMRTWLQNYAPGGNPEPVRIDTPIGQSTNQ